MFMFRMIIYLYELKHARKPETLIDTLGYFFLLPNYCFLHFPVVDYRTFQRGYFAKDIHATQREGLRMMFQGTLHLLLYRLVYHEWLIPAAEVHDPLSLARYLGCNYLLYLRVSGQFHMACGMLHLFGYQLPETHHHYLLATGFTDYWRRINIYWKDFMVRVVFNPVVFRLKRVPQGAALAVATVVVFLVTWFLHAYQSYWLRGTWGFSWPDGLFWGILGVLVLVNVQLDARAPRRRGRPAAALTAGALALRAGKTAATFTTIALLWSLWSSPSLGEWVALMRRAGGSIGTVSWSGPAGLLQAAFP
jgi:D-alanyl-lipoteichoic acid acyltransferase DltB (MBOAT superfamily)